jgi:hypothetical protein
MSLGLSPPQLAALVCLRPDALLPPLDEGPVPVVAYLKSLGATAEQAGGALLAAPGLLAPGGGWRGAVDARLAALRGAGIGPDGVREMLARGHTGWLTEPGAPRDALECLRGLGYSDEQARGAVAPGPGHGGLAGDAPACAPTAPDARAEGVPRAAPGSARGAAAAAPFPPRPPRASARPPSPHIHNATRRRCARSRRAAPRCWRRSRWSSSAARPSCAR